MRRVVRGMILTAWTPELVEACIVEAARVLRVSRSAASAPGPMRAAWPDAPQNAREAYGYGPPPAGSIARPSAAALSALDEVMGWLARYLSVEACGAVRLASDAGWLLWVRADGWAWPKIGEARVRRWGGAAAVPGGNSRESLRLIARGALVHLAACLARAGVPLTAGRDGPPVAPVAREDARPVRLPRQMDTRPVLTNAEPCGRCGMIRPKVDGAGWTCGRGLGDVAPELRAQHPAGEPCFALAVAADAVG